MVSFDGLNLPTDQAFTRRVEHMQQTTCGFNLTRVGNMPVPFASYHPVFCFRQKQWSHDGSDFGQTTGAMGSVEGAGYVTGYG